MSEETEVAEPAMDAATAERVSAENMRLLENIDMRQLPLRSRKGIL